MDAKRFTEKLHEAVRDAESKAVRYGHQQLDVEHLLLSLIEQEGGLAVSILTRAGLPVDTLASRLERELGTEPRGRGA